MSVNYENEPMIEIYIFETASFLDQLEQIILSSEKSETFNQEAINEIFRFMHTIKGTSAMMLFNNISKLAHKIEDVFYFIREKKPEKIDFMAISDLLLSSVDFMKIEINKIKNGVEVDGNPEDIIVQLENYLDKTKLDNNVKPDKTNKKQSTETVKQQYYIPQEKKSKEKAFKIYKSIILFEDGCEMENIRAYTVVFSLTELVDELFYMPPDIAENEGASLWIRENGFYLFIKTQMQMEALREKLNETIFLKELQLFEISDEEYSEFVNAQKQIQEQEILQAQIRVDEVTAELSPLTLVEDTTIKMPQVNVETKEVGASQSGQVAQTMISVYVDKLDSLMNMVGELVITEAMVTQSPIAASIESETYQKSARLLHKITGELQDMVMAIRMVPLSTTFVKMHRIVRDMCKKLEKDVKLELFGEETEMDKNIIEKISDPLMHLIRNAIDHGIEDEESRQESGKSKVGTIVLGAKNSGSDVLITIRDDGRGLNKDKILKKALEQGLLRKPKEDMSDKEIYNLILLPGFSTKESVTEFSGRGVGMDVVSTNIEAVGGSIVIESDEGIGTTVTLKIPLTLAIIEGMNIKVGDSRYTIPITAIRESFRPNLKDCIKDPNKNEMVMVRGECYPILRLHNRYGVKNAITKFDEGILIMVEQENRAICIFADELLGQQQVVVKTMPQYINKLKKIDGLAGCTLLGDGHISLILDVAGLASSHVI